ncbi:hypothetical protein N0V87_001195 [Didymella glomerata]|uniref:Uncharacterized protein n=1 Tax=Didymella glomerata TaxID=749621 RepID=A0A9W8X806_9PLEO|nr:hypothetical protein N0V87_001195 [Didymella glomerata]
MAGQRSDINRARDEYEAGDNIDSLAMDLSTMDGADASMYELPIEDWRRVNWQGVTNHVWYYKPIDDRPQYWQKQNHHHIMTVQELQAEARTRQLQLLKTDKAYLLDVLRVNSEVFARQFKELRNHSMHELRYLTVKHKADVDTDYPYSRDDLAFLIADRIANDAVGEYEASLPVGTSQEQKARNSKKTVSAEEQPNIADKRDVSTSGEASTFATKSTQRALAGEETESPSKKPKVLSTSAENVEVGSDTGLVNDHVQTQVPPVMSELAIPRGAETHDERGTQPDRKPSECDVSEDESTAKRSTKTKVPKHVMKRFFKD